MDDQDVADRETCAGRLGELDQGPLGHDRMPIQPQDLDGLTLTVVSSRQTCEGHHRAVLKATAGQAYSYNAQHTEEGTTGFIYSLVTPPAGMTSFWPMRISPFDRPFACLIASALVPVLRATPCSVSPATTV